MSKTMRMAVPFLAASLLTAGCGSGGDGGGSEEIGEGSVLVRDWYGLPIAAVPIETSKGGSVLDATTTDASGSAILDVAQNSSVSVHYDDPSNGVLHSFTLGGVSPGDDVEMPTFHLAPLPELGDLESLLVVTSEVPEVSFIQATATYCGGFANRSVVMGVTSAQMAVDIWPNCQQRDGLYSYYAEGFDPTFEKVWFAAVFDQPLSAEPALVLSSDTQSTPVLVQLSDLPVDMAPVPLLGPIRIRISGSHAGRPVSLGANFLVPEGGGDFEQTFLLPPSAGLEAGAIEAFSQWATAGGQQWFLATSPGTTTLSIDGGALPEPPEILVENAGDDRIRVLWSNTGGDVAVVTITDEGIFWRLYVDPSTGSVTLPPVPADRAEFVPDFATASASVTIIDIDFLEGFPDYVALGPGPLPEQWIVRAGSTGTSSIPIVLRQ